MWIDEAGAYKARHTSCKYTKNMLKYAETCLNMLKNLHVFDITAKVSRYSGRRRLENDTRHLHELFPL